MCVRMVESVCVCVQVDKLQGDTLIALAELVVQGVKDGLHQALELFPKLLAAISSKKTIKYWKGKGRTKAGKNSAGRGVAGVRIQQGSYICAVVVRIGLEIDGFRELLCVENRACIIYILIP